MTTHDQARRLAALRGLARLETDEHLAWPYTHRTWLDVPFGEMCTAMVKACARSTRAGPCPPSPATYMLYATWPMRGAALMCYDSWRERGPLAAVDAENRSHREGNAHSPPLGAMWISSWLEHSQVARGSVARRGRLQLPDQSSLQLSATSPDRASGPSRNAVSGTTTVTRRTISTTPAPTR